MLFKFDPPILATAWIASWEGLNRSFWRRKLPHIVRSHQKVSTVHTRKKRGSDAEKRQISSRTYIRCIGFGRPWNLMFGWHLVVGLYLVDPLLSFSSSEPISGSPPIPFIPPSSPRSMQLIWMMRLSPLMQLVVVRLWLGLARQRLRSSVEECSV